MNAFRTQVWALVGAVVCVCPSLHAAPATYSDQEIAAIETFLQEGFTENYASMVIGILDETGSRVFATGRLDNGTDRMADGDTVYEIGSVSKVFTTLLALDLDREGTVKLDDPVATWLPEGTKVTSFEGAPITLRNLACQDSGLPFHPNNLSSPDVRAGSETYTMDLLNSLLATYPLTNAPGTRFQYSNVGMAVLGIALEHASGTTWESLVIKRICEPLGMNDTRMVVTPAQESRFAMGHGENKQPSGHLELRVLAPAGALRSTANDLLKFLSAYLGFSPSSLLPLMEEMQKLRHRGDREFGNTAMPWVDMNVYNPPGSELLGHSGGTWGSNSFIGFDRKRRRAVVVLTNQVTQHSGPVGWTILQGLPLTKESTTIPVQEIAGIGAALAMDPPTGLLRITRVLPNTPAQKSGLMDGLLIARVNGVPVKGLEVAKCVELIRGPVGSTVLLELVEPSGELLNRVEVTRGKFLTVN